MLAVLTLLAQTDAPKVPPAYDYSLFLLLPLLLVFMVFLPARKERKQRQQMLSGIEKGDRVVVNGAFIGTVVQTPKADDKADELLVKIDENANVRMRVLRSSVTGVVKDTKAKDPKDGA
jgi:preprotein translocase YajC subunit